MNNMQENPLSSYRATDAGRPSYVDGGAGRIPFNTQVISPYDSSVDSSVVDVYTGIMDTGRLTKLRERAVYDQNTLSYAPVADSGTGVLFPGAVQAKTEIESALRIRPTSFKGPKQLDVDSDDVHLNRQFHPNGWQNPQLKSGAWSKDKNLPFVGFPNANIFYSYMEAIPTHNVQSLSQTQLRDALRFNSTNLNNEGWLDTLGSFLATDTIKEPQHAVQSEEFVYSNGGGVNSDPRLLDKLSGEYELDFERAKRIQTANFDPANDPRYMESGPGSAYTKTQHQFMENQEDYFTKLNKWSGIGSSYTHPVKWST
jgi:hypothetical protein